MNHRIQHGLDPTPPHCELPGIDEELDECRKIEKTMYGSSARVVLKDVVPRQQRYIRPFSENNIKVTILVGTVRCNW